MLAELSIKNFAIIESVSLSFEKGLTVLTGETGAGKSIIIDAIGLLIGGRGSSEFVRHGASKAELEGLFLIENNNHPSIEKCLELGIDVNDDMIVLRRTISHNGKSICRINGKLVTISILREVGRLLVDIHGQHEHQDLMNSDRHIHLLDSFDSEKMTIALNEYKRVYTKFVEYKNKLKQLNENEQQMAHRLDLIQFQLNEIKKANLEPGEDEKLMEEKLELANFEKIHHSLRESYQALSSEQKGMDWVGLAMSHLEEAAPMNEELNKLYETVANSFYLIEEATFSLRNHLDSLEFDPERLNFIESRLNEITFLKKKYGQTVTEILEYASKIEDEVDTILNREHHVEKIKNELHHITEDVMVEAKNLSTLRKGIAKTLTDAIYQELKELYMEKTKFQIEFNLTAGSIEKDEVMNGKPVKFHQNGVDDVEFLISPNPGEPIKPLSKVASGGELSRIMLALKSIFSKQQGITSIIFDEVDTGVSGRVAQAIAEKIHRISHGSQVFCITHLPQVAAMADTHFYIAKEMDEESTKTTVQPLSGEEMIKEIGRMLSGVEITELTKEHARELIDIAEQMKVKM